MRGAGRSLLLAGLLGAALVSLVVLIASLQAPVPGGGRPGEGGPGVGEGSGGAGGDAPFDPDVREADLEPCPPTGEASAAGVAPALAVLPAGRSRRGRLLGLLGLAALAAGCSEPGSPCVEVQVSPTISQGGGGGDGGSGGGLGGSDGPGTGPGTEPDPPKLDPRALWIVLVVLGVVLLAALLVAALSSRKGKGGGAGGAEGAAEAGAEAPPVEAATLLSGVPDGNARAVVLAYVEACRALAARGVARWPWETARELAQRAPEGSREPMTRLTGLYEAARHGGVQPSDEAVRQARLLAREVMQTQAPPRGAEGASGG